MYSKYEEHNYETSAIITVLPMQYRDLPGIAFKLNGDYNENLLLVKLKKRHFKFLLIDSNLKNDELNKFQLFLEKELKATKVDLERVSFVNIHTLNHNSSSSYIQLSFLGSHEDGLMFSTYGDYITNFIVKKIEDGDIHIIFERKFEVYAPAFAKSLYLQCFQSFYALTFSFYNFF